MADGPRRALTVRDLMTTCVVTTSPDGSVADAAAAMAREKVGSALIMQGRFLAGILTERDVLRAAASGSDLTESPVSAWMTKDPEQASPDTTVEDAVQLMLLNGFRHLPVLEGREVRGVVSLRDLAATRIIRPARPRLALVIRSSYQDFRPCRCACELCKVPPLWLRGAPGVRRAAFADTFNAAEVMAMRPEDKNARQVQRAFADGATLAELEEHIAFLRSLGAPDDAHPKISVGDDYEVAMMICVVQRSASQS